MINKTTKRITIITLLMILALIFSGCSQEKSVAPPLEKKEGVVLVTKMTGKNVLESGLITLDISNLDQGYFGIKYSGKNKSVKLQLTKEDEVYTYNLMKQNQYEVFPITAGDGQYELSVFESLGNEQFSQICAETLDVKLEHESLPFLYPSEYVKYTANDQIVALSKKVTSGNKEDLAKVEDVFNYVTKTISYDWDLAANVETNYLPDIDSILKKKEGICFDYAAVMSAMLRSQWIPTKLVIGYAGDIYHAWISVYVADQGWVDGVIQFDGQNWTMMDPTAAASAKSKKELIEDKDKYNALYFY